MTLKSLADYWKKNGILEKAVTARARPEAFAHSRPFWAAAVVGNLMLPRCMGCGQMLYPPPPRCPSCWSDALAWEAVSHAGRVSAWTRVHVAAAPGFEPPFLLAEVAMTGEPGLRITAALTAPVEEDPVIGLPVTTTFTTPENGWAAIVFAPMAPDNVSGELP